MSDPDQPEGASPATSMEEGEAAFDLWLHRRLHQLYGAIAEEPVPDALLRLIEGDRDRRRGGNAGRRRTGRSGTKAEPKP